MEGRCGTCKAALTVIRASTSKPLRPFGIGDAPSAECPNCGARVYVSGTGRVEALEKAVSRPPRGEVPPSEDGIIAKMLWAIARQEDIEISHGDLEEAARLEQAAEDAEDVRFLLEE